MKITRVESFILHVPLNPPITDAINSPTHWGLPGASTEVIPQYFDKYRVK
ncbi:hypothetical protein ACFQZT_21555 [Paenibacillus sp. GCM10027628]